MGRPDLFRLEFFNVFESAARILLNEYPPFDRSDKAQGTKPHLVVVGIGHMGESLVVNAARRWRDANNTNDKRLHVTLIDKDATGKKASLYLRYPQMERVCELVPVQLDVQSAEFEQGEFLLNANKECDVTIIYVCLDDDSNSMAAGLTLSNRLTNFKITGNEIPIVVRMVHEAGLATLLRVQGNQPGGFANLHAFGVLDQTCTPELILGCTFEILARAFHEEYIRNEIKKGNTPQKNPSMVPWEKLSEGLRESNLKAAEHIPVKLAAVDCAMTITTDWQVPVFQFSEQEIEKMAVMEHERWVKERLKAKWKPGPRDPVKKTSPYLVDWSKLAEDVKEIDRILVRNIPLVVAKAGFQIYRLKSRADK